MKEPIEIDFKSVIDPKSITDWYNYLIILIAACSSGLAGGIAQMMLDRYGSPDKPPTPQELRKPAYYYMILAILCTIPTTLILIHYNIDVKIILVISFFSGMGAATILTIFASLTIQIWKIIINRKAKLLNQDDNGNKN